jgi:hypothetical protein
LLQTASLLLNKESAFFLSQSFAYDPETEDEMDQACHDLGLKRTILLDSSDKGNQHYQKQISGFLKIQVFEWSQ